MRAVAEAGGWYLMEKPGDLGDAVPAWYMQDIQQLLTETGARSATLDRQVFGARSSAPTQSSGTLPDLHVLSARVDLGDIKTRLAPCHSTQTHEMLSHHAPYTADHHTHTHHSP